MSMAGLWAETTQPSGTFCHLALRRYEPQAGDNRTSFRLSRLAGQAQWWELV